MKHERISQSVLTCRAFHDERQSLKRLVGSLAAVSAPPDFDFRLRARISAAKNGASKQRSSWRSFLASAPAIGLAASFALLVAGFVFYNQMKRAPAPGNQAGEIARQTSQAVSEQRSKAPASNVADSSTQSVTQSVTPPPDVKEESPTLNAGVKGARPRSIGKPNGARRVDPRRPDNQQDVSNDFARRPAPVITPAGASPLVAESQPVVELSIRSASQPMRVFVDDRSGAKRTVTLEPVIFGSQDFTGRNASRIAPSSQGIW